MSSNRRFPSMLVRTYRKSEHELSVEIHNDLGRLLAVGHCTSSTVYPQVVLNNVCLPVEIYGYEYRRWLNIAISWCLGDKASVNFETSETLFEDDYLD